MSKEKKLSKDELADFVTNLQLRYPKAFFHTEKLLKRANQAFGQLKQLIEAQAEPNGKPELRGLTIEEICKKYPEQVAKVLKEAPMRKPKVGKEWIQTLIYVCDDIEDGEMSIENLYEMLKESWQFDVYGLDVDVEKVKKLEQSSVFPNKFDVMHICIPFKDDKKFIDIVFGYAKKYNPELIIINSTVAPKITRRICRKLLIKQQYTLMAHSPVRGMHGRMKEDLKQYTKYVGGCTKYHGQLAEKHLKKAGFKTKLLETAIETELAKLFETTYTAVQMACWQEFHRVAQHFGAKLDNVADMVDDTGHVQANQYSLLWFPDVIGGHCLMPNLKILSSNFKSDLLKSVIKSNEKRKEEVKDEKTIREIKKLKERFRKNQEMVKHGKGY